MLIYSNKYTVFIIICYQSIRQVLHSMQMWRAQSTSMRYTELKDKMGSIEKDKVLYHPSLTRTSISYPYPSPKLIIYSNPTLHICKHIFVYEYVHELHVGPSSEPFRVGGPDPPRPNKLRREVRRLLRGLLPHTPAGAAELHRCGQRRYVPSCSFKICIALNI